MKNELRDRLQTLAEMRLLDIDIGEYLEEIVQKYGEKKVEIAAAEAGLQAGDIITRYEGNGIASVNMRSGLLESWSSAIIMAFLEAS